jgi:SOS-response transcriptional repressor LexA
LNQQQLPAPHKKAGNSSSSSKLQANIKKILNPTSALEEQRVRDNEMHMQQQRVINNTPIITVPVVPRITNAPPILQARNPTAKVPSKTLRACTNG